MSGHWKKSMGAGDSRMDKQHKALFGVIDDMERRITAPKDRDAVFRAWKELHGHAAYHFACQEQLMLENGYPGHAEHAAEHDDFLKLVARRMSEAPHNTNALKGMPGYLRKWLSGHIRNSDGRFAAYLGDIPPGLKKTG